MWDPTCSPAPEAGQPDRLTSPLFPCGCIDNGGVHIGSGVLNHAFAMLVDGKTFNGHVVPGIGLIKAAAVWYRALTVYLDPLSSFSMAHQRLNVAAADLIDTRPLDPRTGQPVPIEERFTPQDALAVDAALRAVELDLSPPCQDGDGDGVPDGCDNCSLVFNPDQSDDDSSYDPDHQGDACDPCTDSDRDGFGDPGFAPNVCPADNCPRVSNPEQTDANLNGVGDACEDPDGDGAPSGRDNCDFLFNPLQENADEDATGDACDPCTDSDGDGFGDPAFPHTCATDNCPNVANPSQADGDGDGIGDACGPPPANDNCAAAAVVLTTPFTSAVDSRHATNEIGEPYFADPSNPARRELATASVWYRFLAPRSGVVTAQVRDSTTYPTVITAYTGACGALSKIAVGTVTCATFPSVEFQAEAGTAYYIAVGEPRFWGIQGGHLDLAVTFAAGQTLPGSCVGDCDKDESVTIDEILTGINIGLGQLPPANCLAADRNRDRAITVDELVAAVNNAVAGCQLRGPGVPAVTPVLQIDPPVIEGTQITYPIRLREGIGIITGAQVDLLYDPTAMLNPVCEKDRRLMHQSLRAELVTDPPSPAGTARVRVMVGDMNLAQPFDDGVIGTCTFTALGAANVCAGRAAASDADGNPVLAAVSNGCVNGGRMRKATIRYSPQDLSASLTFEPAPGGPAIDPSINGLTVRLNDGDGCVLREWVVPGGTHWRAVGSGSTWYFDDPNGTLADGITDVMVKLSPTTREPRRYYVKIRARGPFASVAADSLPLQAALTLGGQAQAAAGQCGVAGFGNVRRAPRCTMSTTSGRVKCR